ncbi:MAG: type 1 glutamine amidotransferase [Solirubrobacteraceae bacterium]
MLEQQDDAGAGFVGDWLDAAGLDWDVVRAEDPHPDPALPRAIISLGSSHSAYQSAPPWIPLQVELLRAALAAQTPVLGICFGAQSLALAAGGTVTREQQPEIGWVHPESEHPELRGPWLAWHSDAITLPPGAVELARSPAALQAFRLGRSFGVQFHPEVTPEIWDAWAAEEPEAIRGHVGDHQALALEIAERAGDLRTRLFALLDWWQRTVLNG